MDKAARAAEEGAIYEMLLAGLETRLSVLTWMACAKLGLTVLAIGRLVTLASKLGEMSGEIACGIQ